jgi:hypothetical protein
MAKARRPRPILFHHHRKVAFHRRELGSSSNRMGGFLF